MSVTLQIVLVCIGIAVVLYFTRRFWMKSEDKQIRKDLSGLGIAGSFAKSFGYKYTTPGGVGVRSTAVVPADALAAIDEGIRNQIERHNVRYPHWPFYRSLSDYNVVFIDPMAVNVETEPGSPALLVHGIQTAGTCIGVWVYSAVRRPYIVLPHQGGSGWRYRDYLMRSAWHESEHVREWTNDVATFQMYIGSGDVHPHVP